MTPDPIALPQEFSDAQAIARERLGIFANRVLWYSEVGSTNDIAATFAEQGVDEGFVVLADRQTAGRGRLGRSWASPPGAGIYVSVILRPSAAAARLVTIAAGVAGLILSAGFVNDLVFQLGEALIHSQTGPVQIGRSGYFESGSRAPGRYLITPEALARLAPE